MPGPRPLTRAFARLPRPGAPAAESAEVAAAAAVLSAAGTEFLSLPSSRRDRPGSGRRARRHETNQSQPTSFRQPDTFASCSKHQRQFCCIHDYLSITHLPRTAAVSLRRPPRIARPATSCAVDLTRESLRSCAGRSRALNANRIQKAPTKVFSWAAPAGRFSGHQRWRGWAIWPGSSEPCFIDSAEKRGTEQMWCCYPIPRSP